MASGACDIALAVGVSLAISFGVGGVIALPLDIAVAVINASVRFSIVITLSRTIRFTLVAAEQASDNYYAAYDRWTESLRLRAALGTLGTTPDDQHEADQIRAQILDLEA